VPFGFARESDDTLAPIEDEIGIVKEIFHLYSRRRLGCAPWRPISTNAACGAAAPVIDPTMFELAQDILAQRGEAPKKAGSPSDYHLTGKIVCPVCARRWPRLVRCRGCYEHKCVVLQSSITAGDGLTVIRWR
jgi:hypothetical protein